MQIVDTIFKLAVSYQINALIIEKGTIEKSLGPFIRAEMMKRGKFFHIEALTMSTDKVTRARSIQARMRSQGVKFDKNKVWFSALENEMLRFPKDVHDDQVDAMSNLGLVLDKFIEGPTVKELENEDYEEYEAQFQDFDTGRSIITGY